MTELRAPFPWFGGKREVAEDVWSALGDVDHYIEPFFGSGAVLLGRPHAPRFETVNDADGLLANFWRAVRADPDAVAEAADWPANEADLHARHLWLVGQRESLTDRLMGDAAFYDAKAAGWWVWGACNWIGSGFCAGTGPWVSVDGVIADVRQLPHLTEGRGVNRQLPHLTSAQGVNRQLPHLTEGRGVNRKLFIQDWFVALSDRLRETRVACGDWSRVTGPSVLGCGGGICGVFLDPPYALDERASVYSHESGAAADCLKWCLENGDRPSLRIVLAGYAGEHDALEDKGWRVMPWKARGGYGSQGEGRGRDNASRERLWMSPNCIGATPDLFSFANDDKTGDAA
jgi:hypothetical protein